MTRKEAIAAIEATLFISGDPIEIEVLSQGMHMPLLEVQSIVMEMQETYAEEDRGLELFQTEEGIQLRTKAVYKDVIRDVLKPVSRKTLSRSVLETLSVIAYHQPITRAEIEEIKGVSCDYSMQLLLKRNLIQSVGRKDTIGKPKLYGTTQDFLRFLDIHSLKELPPLKEPSPQDAEDGFEIGE